MRRSVRFVPRYSNHVQKAAGTQLDSLQSVLLQVNETLHGPVTHALMGLIHRL
jgi:hypothetical protein